MDDAGQEEGHAPDIQIVDSDEVEFSLGKEVWDLPLEELPDISFRFEGRHGGQNLCRILQVQLQYSLDYR